MSLRKNSLIRYFVPAIAVLGAVIGGSSPSHAYVNQIVIDQTATVNFTPIILGTSTPGTSTSYTIYQGRIFGNLSPTNPLNSVITDIGSAPQTGGSVTYIANFQIVTPTNPAARSGLLIHEVPNRGGNSISTGALIQGATYVQSGWQGDLLAQCSPATATPYPCINLNSGPYGTLNTTTGAFTPPTVTNVTGTASLASYVVQVPVATSDGTPPNGTNTITGQEYGHVCIGTNGCGLAVGTTTSTAQLQIQGPAFVPYQPVSTDTNQAQLWTVPSQNLSGVDGTKTMIPSSQWAWAYCPSGWPGTPNPNYICLNGATFNPSLMYEVVYTAANPLVLGVGGAAFRDLTSFLRYGTTAPGGGSNPLAGSITRTYTVGSSQSGAFIHAFLFYGFNEDEDGRIVFDGAWPQIDGRMMVMNIRWGQPNNLMYLYMGGDEAPVWWADYPNLARSLPADGMLHRCSATGTCPQILETFASAEMYSEKMSVSLCGFTCAADIPLPSNVYRYYTPGATHGGGTVSFNYTAPSSISTPAGQLLPQDPIPETYTNNALQAAFIQLILNGTAMPPSVYPTLAAGQLAVNTAAAVGFPSGVPNLTYEGTQAWPPYTYNFGPGENYDQESGVPTVQPPTIQQVLPVYVPTVNADGNENVAGLPTVLGQAPLGTYVGWNLATTGWYGPNEADGPSSAGQVFAGAGNSGGFWPFWDTAAHRTSAGDPRLSLEERYGTHAGYNCLVKQASYSAVAQRYLLSSDAATMMNLASSSNAVTGFSPTLADTSLANTLCMAPTHNYNADGLSDILWQDTSGNLALWEMNGSTVLNANTAGFGAVPAPWAIVGQRDFNGDGNADILWRNTTTGDIAIWEMNGTTILNANTAGLGNVPTAWSIVGTGDFNGDGMADILWRNTTTGDLAIWEMNGTTILNANTAGVGNVPLNWTVVGVGDFNGDGKADILWRNNNGNVAIWLMNGTTLTNANTATFGNMPASWSVAGTGDFNGDRMSDILWRDTSGNIAIWEMNGTTITNANTSGVGNLSTVWTVAETGDFDGNGKSDILWRDTSGDIAIWFMNGTTIASGAGLGTIPTTFTIQGTNAD